MYKNQSFLVHLPASRASSPDSDVPPKLHGSLLRYFGKSKFSNGPSPHAFSTFACVSLPEPTDETKHLRHPGLPTLINTNHFDFPASRACLQIRTFQSSFYCLPKPFFFSIVFLPGLSYTTPRGLLWQTNHKHSFLTCRPPGPVPYIQFFETLCLSMLTPIKTCAKCAKCALILLQV